MKMNVIESKLQSGKSNLIILSDQSHVIKAKETIEKIENQAALGEVIADFAH